MSGAFRAGLFLGHVNASWALNVEASTMASHFVCSTSWSMGYCLSYGRTAALSSRRLRRPS